MRNRLLHVSLVAVSLLLACDDDGAEAGATGAAFVGTWELLEEDGMELAGYGITLTLTNDTFSSTFLQSSGQECTWSGSVTSDDTTQTWTVQEATAAPCNTLDPEPRTADWLLSDGGATLTLDWSATPAGAVQVYARR